MQRLPPINFSALASALLDRAEQLVERWLPGGERVGREYKCADLCGGAGASCSVNLVTGVWKDFATDEGGGDLIDLYAAIHGLPKGKAAVQVARDEGLEDVAGVRREGAPPPAGTPAPPSPPPPPAPPPAASGAGDGEGWQTMLPVPADAPAPTFRHWHRSPADITHRAAYRLDGHLLGYVIRFATSDGGKDVLPHTWCRSDRDGGMAWKWKQWDAPRPLYLPGGAKPAGRTVILVEGEKKADILQALLDASAPGVYCVASWPGGCKAWPKAAWDWLAGAHVLLWPDCDAKRAPLPVAQRKALAGDATALQQALDALPLLPAARQPGLAAMLAIGAQLVAAHACTVQVLPIPEPGAVKDGWDCADAIEADGWDAARVLAFLGQAQPLPAVDSPAPAATPAAPPEAPARERPVGTAGGDAPSTVGDGKRPYWLAPFWDEEKGRWMVSRRLVIKALRHDPALAGVLAFNRLSNSIDARRDWPFEAGSAGAVRNSHDLLIGNYLTDTYGLPSIARASLAEGMETVGHAAPYHPVVEYLEGLAWDGTPRLDKWLMYVLGETPQTVSARLAEYLQLVGRYLVLGLVARVMEPGCKFDYCVVLEGKGGLYKSTALKTLVGRRWFSDTRFDVQKNKEAQEQVQGVWLYELGELAHFNKAGVDEIKAFVSSEVDRYRPAYGRNVESFPRQCVLAATTNNRRYLRDKTGNRRFWPVPVNHVMNVGWIERNRDQLFAEALHLYRAGERHWPDEATEVRLFVPMQQERMVVDAVEEELLRVLTRAPVAAGIGAEVNDLTQHVTVAQLIQALGVDVGKANAGLQSQVRAWLDQEGWEHKKVTVGATRLMRYVRPAVWPAPDDGEPDEPAAPPAGSGPGDAAPAGEGMVDDAPF